MKLQSLSFVFPVYNELANIEACIQRATYLSHKWGLDYEIIVVDDASLDGTGKKIDELAAKDGRIIPIHLKVNSLLGGALKRGLETAAKEAVLYTDADFSIREEDMEKAIGLLTDNDIVSAYSLATKGDGLRRIIISKIYNWLAEILFSLHLRDINCGFKIYKREALKDLEFGSRSPFINVEIFVEARKRNFKISQCGVVFQVAKGKSSLTRPGIMARTFLEMIYYKLNNPCYFVIYVLPIPILALFV